MDYYSRYLVFGVSVLACLLTLYSLILLLYVGSKLLRRRKAWGSAIQRPLGNVRYKLLWYAITIPFLAFVALEAYSALP